ncbi:MAG TPA: DUF5313 family protein [Jatrophihabitans sp.]|nr:DUF5313 family protein [Jatrophihabitans sp.]
MNRPPFLLWLRYAFGAGLPPEYSQWVLHDATCSSWLLRHFARVVTVVVVPGVLLLLFMPTSLGIRVLTVITVVGCQVLLLGILANEVTERRVYKAGFPWGAAAETRQVRVVEDQRRANRERRERTVARRQRHF